MCRWLLVVVVVVVGVWLAVGSQPLDEGIVGLSCSEQQQQWRVARCMNIKLCCIPS